MERKRIKNYIIEERIYNEFKYKIIKTLTEKIKFDFYLYLNYYIVNNVHDFGLNRNLYYLLKYNKGI